MPSTNILTYPVSLHRHPDSFKTQPKCNSRFGGIRRTYSTSLGLQAPVNEKPEHGVSQ